MEMNTTENDNTDFSVTNAFNTRLVSPHILAHIGSLTMSGTLTDQIQILDKKFDRLFGTSNVALGTNIPPGLDFTRKSNVEKRSNIPIERKIEF